MSSREWLRPVARLRRIARVACVALVCAGAQASAESSFLLPYPQQFGPMPAATYDEEGERIGGADLLVEELASGHVRIRSESGQRDGARTVATAELAPVEPGETLRVVFEESRSLDEDGEPLGVLSIDHRAGLARCRGADGETTSVLELPRDDRVLNVPLNLFFVPLVNGDASSLEFQLFLCRPDARLMDFQAWVADSSGGPPHVEVRYGPDFGLASMIARSMAPRLSFWFDRVSPYTWMAHRMPLYSGGPEVFVVRDDVPGSSLTH